MPDTAAARDAVKKEALRRAGIGYHEVVAGHTTAGELRRLVEKLVPGAVRDLPCDYGVERIVRLVRLKVHCHSNTWLGLRGLGNIALNGVIAHYCVKSAKLQKSALSP